MADLEKADYFFYNIIDLIHSSLLREFHPEGSASNVLMNLRALYENIRVLSRQQRRYLALCESKLSELQSTIEEKYSSILARPAKLQRIDNTISAYENGLMDNEWELIHNHSAESSEMSSLIQAAVNINSDDVLRLVALHALAKLAWERRGCKGETATAFLMSQMDTNQSILPVGDLLYAFISDVLTSLIDDSSRMYRRFIMMCLGLIIAESDATSAPKFSDLSFLGMLRSSSSNDTKTEVSSIHGSNINLLRIECSLHYPKLRENFILSTLFSVHLASNWIHVSQSRDFLKVPIECGKFLDEIVCFASIPLLVSYWNWLLFHFVRNSSKGSNRIEIDSGKILKNMLAVIYVSFRQSSISFVEFAKEAISVENLLQFTPCFIDGNGSNVLACSIFQAIHFTFMDTCRSIPQFLPSRRELLIRQIHIFQSCMWFLRHFEPALLDEEEVILNNCCYFSGNNDIFGENGELSGICSVIIANKRIANVCHSRSVAEFEESPLSRLDKNITEAEKICINHLEKYYHTGINLDSARVVHIPCASLLIKASLKMQFSSVESLNHYSKAVRSICSDVFSLIECGFSFETTLIGVLISFCEDCDWNVPPSSCGILCNIFDAFYEPCNSKAAFGDKGICAKLIDRFLHVLRNSYSIRNESMLPSEKFLTLMLRSLEGWLRFKEGADQGVNVPLICVDIIGQYPKEVHEVLELPHVRLNASCSKLVNSILSSNYLRNSPRGSSLNPPTTSLHAVENSSDLQQSSSELLSLEPRSPHPFKATDGTPRAKRYSERNESLAVRCRELFSECNDSTTFDCSVLVPSPVEHVICTSPAVPTDHDRDSKTAPCLPRHSSPVPPVASSEVLSDIDFSALSKKFSAPFAKFRK